MDLADSVRSDLHEFSILIRILISPEEHTDPKETVRLGAGYSSYFIPDIQLLKRYKMANRVSGRAQVSVM